MILPRLNVWPLKPWPFCGKRWLPVNRSSSCFRFCFRSSATKRFHYLRRESLKYQIHGSIGSDASREIQFRINTLEACDPHALYAEDVQTILHKSLDALGRQTRRVFMLSRFDGMSNRQIAQELGISEKSVEYHVTKALKQLRTDLKDYLPLIYLFLGI